MRIVDCFTDVILYARKLSRGDVQSESSDEVRSTLKSLFSQSKSLAVEHGLSDEVYIDAKFPVVALLRLDV